MQSVRRAETMARRNESRTPARRENTSPKRKRGTWLRSFRHLRPSLARRAGKGDRHLLPRPTFGRCPPFGCFAQKVPVTFSRRRASVLGWGRLQVSSRPPGAGRRAGGGVRRSRHSPDRTSVSSIPPEASRARRSRSGSAGRTWTASTASRSPARACGPRWSSICGD